MAAWVFSRYNTLLGKSSNLGHEPLDPWPQAQVLQIGKQCILITKILTEDWVLISFTMSPQDSLGVFDIEYSSRDSFVKRSRRADTHTLHTCHAYNQMCFKNVQILALRFWSPNLGHVVSTCPEIGLHGLRVQSLVTSCPKLGLSLVSTVVYSSQRLRSRKNPLVIWKILLQRSNAVMLN